MEQPSTSALARWLAALLVWSAVLLSLLLRDADAPSVRLARQDIALCRPGPAD